MGMTNLEIFEPDDDAAEGDAMTHTIPWGKCPDSLGDEYPEGFDYYDGDGVDPWHWVEATERLLAKGQRYNPIKPPDGYQLKIPKGEDARCFNRCIKLVAAGRGLYVEGFFLSPPGSDMPIHHGWITFDGIHAIDPTIEWRKAEQCFYFGVQYKTAEVLERYPNPEESWCMMDDMPDKGWPNDRNLCRRIRRRLNSRFKYGWDR